MLQLINQERQKAGVLPVTLGDNAAAQLHAESSLANSFSGHWGVDGLKPYMRYSLAGGYQSNGENGSGLDYCIRAGEGYAANLPAATEIQEAMQGWMDSPGHRRNILDPWHKKVNIGLAWDRYNFSAYQHFEGGYVEYTTLPTIHEDTLSFEGMVQNGAEFAKGSTIHVEVEYDPPPHHLTRGQVAGTYCYTLGQPVAFILEPLSSGSSYLDDGHLATRDECPNPYDISPSAPGPSSYFQAMDSWSQAQSLSQQFLPTIHRVPYVIASEWHVADESFSIAADLSAVVDEYGRESTRCCCGGRWKGIRE